MPGSTIVPGTPVVNQGDQIVQHGEDTSAGLDTLQRIFDQVAPEIKTEPTPKVSKPAAPEKPAAPPEKEVTPPEKPTKKEPQKPAEDSHKLPSFLEEAIKVEHPGQADKPAVEDEWPEELPTFKSGDEARERYKRWRQAYNNIKEEARALKARPVQDEATLARLKTLESDNKQMGEVLSRMGVETHAEFQNNIIRPMAAAWQEAAQIVKDSGSDPNDLAKALALSGKAQFEALDTLMQEMPESAKAEVHDALRRYRHYAQVRNQALAEAPKTMQALQEKEMQHQYQLVNQQREEMKNLFEDAVKTLRDKAKVEVLLKSDDPESKWWNEQADQIISNGRDLYLENTDMRKMAMAAVLAPMADAYRKLWLAERGAHSKTKKMVQERFGAEPSLSESSGGDRNSTPDAQFKDDLKKPFQEVFLREFHRQQATTNR